MQFIQTLICLVGLSLILFSSTTMAGAKSMFLDGGNSPGTYEPDPDDNRRTDPGGPYNEPGSDDDRRGNGHDHGGPYNEPGSDDRPH